MGALGQELEIKDQIFPIILQGHILVLKIELYEEGYNFSLLYCLITYLQIRLHFDILGIRTYEPEGNTIQPVTPSLPVLWLFMGDEQLLKQSSWAVMEDLVWRGK